MLDIYTFLKILTIFAIIDIPMITYINYDMYKKQLNRIQGASTISQTRVILSAIVVYMLLAFSIYYFAIKCKSVLNGFLIGFCIYGVYNGTNLATIKHWGLYESIIDTLWGSILSGVITWIAINY
jgi:uncharacterized membrane protein